MGYNFTGNMRLKNELFNRNDKKYHNNTSSSGSSYSSSPSINLTVKIEQPSNVVSERPVESKAAVAIEDTKPVISDDCKLIAEAFRYFFGKH